VKTRDGFISNSSSSSFVVVLSPKFNIDKFIDENYEKNPDTDEELVFAEEALSRSELVDVIKQIRSGKIIYENDCDYGIYVSLQEKLKDFVIVENEIGPDEGHILGLKMTELERQLKKIKEYGV